MPTIYIDGTVVQVPTLFSPGHILTTPQAVFLEEIHLARLNTKLRYLLANGAIGPETLPAKALELNQAPLEPWGINDALDGNDPVAEEALALARERILSRMAQENLPPPKGLDTHARALLVADGGSLLEHARRRVEARYRAAAILVGA